VALLKIHKAQYGKKIFVNGQFVAEHLPSYTAAYINVQPFLKPAGEENELIIRLGNYYNFADSLVNGHDFEKVRFISGIYDDVELIQSAYPYIQNVQIAPDIKTGEITVVAELNSDENKSDFNLSYTILEHKSGKSVAKGKVAISSTGGVDTTKMVIKIPDFKLWSPEDPFLYDLKLNSGADSYSTRFGLREFRFDTITGRALLNNKVFYMNGTNVPVFRFFEDSLRGDYPWNKEWVRKLNTQFQDMHWNIIRYHVGPAPDFWYDLADEMGILIQDEFAIWWSKGAMQKQRPNMKAKNIAAEYKDWMRERWNHPCVVIWDAQNETVSEETGKAIGMVRHLDLSNRPWDNGWSRPQSATDAIESHPYLFYDYAKKDPKIPAEGLIDYLLSKPHKPYNDPGIHDPAPDGKDYPNIRFINEYGWLWVNRDGSTTTLSDWVYIHLFGDNKNKAENLYHYARTEAMLTEYWRSQRNNTGVMHFSGLSYSRPHEPRGQTSDNLKSLETLEFDADFYKYVKPAFAPVGIMIDSWKKEYPAGQTIDIPVNVINDLYTDWQGEVELSVSKDGTVISSEKVTLTVPSLGKEISTFKIVVPESKGKYDLKASLKLNEEDVFSLRDLNVN